MRCLTGPIAPLECQVSRNGPLPLGLGPLQPRAARISEGWASKAGNRTYNVEVEVDETEDLEGVFKRFRNQVNNANVLYEVRRRRFHEDHQDILKRKQQEKGLRKIRARREMYLLTYSDTLDGRGNNHVFADLFPNYDQNGAIIQERGESEADQTKQNEHKVIARLDRIEQASRSGMWESRQVAADENAVRLRQTNQVETSEPSSKRSMPFETSKEKRAAKKIEAAAAQSSKVKFDNLEWDNSDSAHEPSQNGAHQELQGGEKVSFKNSQASKLPQNPKKPLGKPSKEREQSLEEMTSLFQEGQDMSFSHAEAALKQVRNATDLILTKEAQDLTEIERNLLLAQIPAIERGYQHTFAMKKGGLSRTQRNSLTTRRKHYRARLEKIEAHCPGCSPTQLARSIDASHASMQSQDFGDKNGSKYGGVDESALQRAGEQLKAQLSKENSPEKELVSQ